MNPRITTVTYSGKHKLLLTFSDGVRKEFDITPYLHYPVYQPLNDEAFCSKAKVFNGTVIWNEEIDFDPDTLYLESKQVNIA